MRTSQVNKEEFLRKWLSTLHQYNNSHLLSHSAKKPRLNTIPNIFERKRAIKLSADVAMASTRTTTSLWSRALIFRARTDCNYYHNNRSVHHKTVQVSKCRVERNRRRARNVVLMMRRRRRKMIDRNTGIPMMTARKMAARLVRRRTAVLRRLVPGGEQMDEYCLIREAVDYILSLKAQVDVMQRLADATTTTIHHQTPSLITRQNN